jgi:hypothetical protein
MDKHANIHFDGNKFTVTDRNGRTDRNRDAFANVLTANTNRDGNAAALLDALNDAYDYANRNGNLHTYAHGYAYTY